MPRLLIEQGEHLGVGLEGAANAAHNLRVVLAPIVEASLGYLLQLDHVDHFVEVSGLETCLLCLLLLLHELLQEFILVVGFRRFYFV